MAGQTVTLEILEQRVMKLEEQVKQLRQIVLSEGVTQEPERVVIEEEEEDQIWARLREEGIVVNPDPRTIELAAEWEALPDEEKQAVREELRALHLEPSLSELIHLMRTDWDLDQLEGDGKSE